MITVKQLRDFLATIPDETEVSFGDEHHSGNLELWYPSGDRGFVTSEGRFVAKAHISTGKFLSTKEVLRDITKRLQKNLAAERKKHPKRS